MAFRYSMVFRDKVCRRLRDGERVENLAHELEVTWCDSINPDFIATRDFAYLGAAT